MINEIQIEEIKINDEKIKIDYHYFTDSYYKLEIQQGSDGWKINMILKKLNQKVEKKSKSILFQNYVENPKVFRCQFQKQTVAHLQIGYDSWNNRVRIWDINIDERFRRIGIGSKMIDFIKEYALNIKARAIVLETQTCNVPAINFYLKHGFELIGFDSIHYTNQDIQKKEVRIELGLIVC